MDAYLRELPQYGVWLVFAAVLLEQAGLPLPSFAVLVAAGALAAGHELSIPYALAAALLPALAANLAWYALGRRHGQRVLRLLCRISLSPDTCVRMTESFFQRYGLASLIVSKFVPGISLVAPPLAGAVRMPAPRFLVTVAIGTLLWASVYLALGYAFHDQLDTLFDYAGRHLRVAAAWLLAAFIAWLGYRAVQRWRAARGGGVPRIAVAELLRRLAGPQPPLVVDLRSPLLRDAQPGVPGAVAAELEALERAPTLPREREIVAYCACPNDAGAVQAVRALLRHGYTRAAVLDGGIEAWQAVVEGQRAGAGEAPRSGITRRAPAA